MKRNSIITGTFVTLLIVIVVSLIGWYVVKPAPILLQGEVEVKSVKISSKLTGRVDSLPVREGERVQKGQLLFVLSTPEIEAKLRQATAAREAADAQRPKPTRERGVRKSTRPTACGKRRRQGWNWPKRPITGSKTSMKKAFFRDRSWTRPKPTIKRRRIRSRRPVRNISWPAKGPATKTRKRPRLW